jgi:hypothetical protein
MTEPETPQTSPQPPRRRPRFFRLKVLAPLLALVTLLLGAGWWFGPSTSLNYFTDSDPTIGPGVQVPIWQLLVRTDSPSIYAKTGNGPNDWTLVGTASGGGGGGGDITAVLAGTSLSGGSTSGDATLNVNLPGASCSASQAVTALSAGGTGTCSTVGDITAVTAGTSLTGGATSGAATLNVALPGGTCSAGQAATGLAADGTLTCSTNVATVAGSGLVTASTASGTATVGLDTTAAVAPSRITFNGTNAEWTGQPWNLISSESCWWDELDVGTGAQSSHLSAATINSGSLTTGDGSDAHPGVWTYSTVATSNGGGRYYTNETGYSLSATDITCVDWIATLTQGADNGTDTYITFIGTGDNSNTVNPVDGFGFIASKTTAPTGGSASADWQIYAIKNSTRSYAVLDGVVADTVLTPIAAGDMAAGTGQVYHFQICGTTARLDFCINPTNKKGICAAGSSGHVGSACASGCSMAATNIPGAGSTTNGSQWGLKTEMVKTAGTSVADKIQVDGAGYCRPFSAPR